MNNEHIIFTPKSIDALPIDGVARCTRDAQKDGVFAGLSSGLVGAIIGSRFMRFSRDKTILCGVLTGVLSGYFFTQAFLESNMARLRVQEAALRTADTSAKDEVSF